MNYSIEIRLLIVHDQEVLINKHRELSVLDALPSVEMTLDDSPKQLANVKINELLKGHNLDNEPELYIVLESMAESFHVTNICLLYTSPSPRDRS